MSKQLNLTRKPKTFVLSVAAIPILTVLPLLNPRSLAVAQTPTTAPTFTVPSTLPSGSTLRIDGSQDMATINTALKERFQARFPGADVKLATNGTTAALQSLLKGDIDLAAIARSLTPAEKDQGLKEAIVRRDKIAIIVGANNPFTQSITAEQFAQIFRGEITDWSELGGPAGPIRVIDRPESSDTRQAFSQYPMFQTAPFQTGTNATQVKEDTTEAVIRQLGRDGISYAIVSQIEGNDSVKTLPLYGMMPTGASYPFSQARGYAYKDNANPQTQAFLGYTTSPDGQAVVASPQTGESQDSATPKATPSDSAQITEAPPNTTPPTSQPFPWWWLLLPFLGLAGLLAWLLRDRGEAGAAPIAEATGATVTLTPRSCRMAHITWDIPAAAKTAYAERGGRSLALRLYDVTDVDLNRQTPPKFQAFDCPANATEQDLSIAVDNRDYVVALGYLTERGDWLPVARSAAARVPACPAGDKIREAAIAAVKGSPQMADNIQWPPGSALEQATAAMVGGSAIANHAAPTATPHQPEDLTAPLGSSHDCRIIVVPRDADTAYVYWEVTDRYKGIGREQGGQALQLRIHDVTNIDSNLETPHHTQVYACSEQDQDRLIRLPASDRDYVAELGYVTADERWLLLSRSVPVYVAAGINRN